jgi:hypothetical protein
VPDSHWLGAGQQAFPRVPQAVQNPERQAMPCWQVVPQHAWPSAPQAEHLPPLHVPPGAVVVPQVIPSATHVPE